VSVLIMFTRLSHEALKNPEQLEELERNVSERIFAECDNVKWIANYAVLGPTDYVDIFEAPDQETAMRVSTIVRTFGHASTEIWGAVEWKRFKEMARHLPGRAGGD